MSTESTPSIADKIFGGVVLLIAGVATVFIVGFVVTPSSPAQPTQADVAAPIQKAPPIQRASTIVASIRDFKLGIPLLEQSGLSRQEDPGGIEYRWASGVTWITFYDFGADGSLDRISAVLATPTDDSNTTIFSAMLALRVISIASGKEISVDEFNAWIASLADGDVVNGETRTVNRTPMRLQGTMTPDGKTGMRLTIGDLR